MQVYLNKVTDYNHAEFLVFGCGLCQDQSVDDLLLASITALRAVDVINSTSGSELGDPGNTLVIG